MDAALFIARVEEIAAEDPIYKQGEYGQNGECDCIGLIIGAIRRAGGQWRGMHGTNYTARQEMEYIKPITGSSDLVPGEVVFKAYEPAQGGYALPKRYEKGGDHYNGDLRDYYHIGVVESVYPLRIRHMTKPKAKMDTSVGKWNYHGKLKKIDIGTGGKVKAMEKVIIAGGDVSAPIRLRKAASTSSDILAMIPQQSEAIMVEGGGTWNQICWDGKTGYVMSIFVQRKSEAAEDLITVSRADIEKAYDILGDVLGLRG